MGGSKKLNFFIGLNWTFANTFYFTENLLKTIPNAVHQGKSGGSSPLGPTPKSVHDKPKERFNICTYMYTQ